MSTFASRGHIQITGHVLHKFLELTKYSLRTTLCFNLPPVTWLWLTWIQFSHSRSIVEGHRLHNHQEDYITKRWAITKKMRFSIHSTTITTKRTQDKMQMREGLSFLVLAEAIMRNQGIGPYEITPHNHTSSNTFVCNHHRTTAHHSPNSIVAWSAQVQTPHQRRETWQVGTRELSTMKLVTNG